MNREEALNLLKEKIKNENLLKHMYATEAVMIELAERFNENKETWGLAGLLHDLDYEETKDNFSMHGKVTVELLKDYNLDSDIIDAIIAHPGLTPREKLIEKAIFAADPITGLIVAAALMHPSKKIANIDSAFLLKRYKEKRFAAGANREQIASCSELGLTLDEFFDLSIKAMQKISDDLGL